MKTSPTAALLGLAALLLLTGCTVGYVPPDATARTTDAAPTRDVASADTDETDAAEPDAAGEPDAANVDLRAQYGATAQETGCDGGEVVVEQAGLVLAIVGDCAVVRVQASGTVVLGEQIGTLEITGAANQVEAHTIDELRLAGSGNEVRWDSGTPDTTDIGAGNTARSTTRG